MATQDEGIRAIEQDEHLEAAHAKKVVERWLNPSTGLWQNVVPNLVPGVDYDYLAVTNTSGTTDSAVFKIGGSGGTAVRSLAITYRTSSVEKLSDKLTSVAFS